MFPLTTVGAPTYRILCGQLGHPIALFAAEELARALAPHSHRKPVIDGLPKSVSGIPCEPPSLSTFLLYTRDDIRSRPGFPFQFSSLKNGHIPAETSGAYSIFLLPLKKHPEPVICVCGHDQQGILYGVEDLIRFHIQWPGSDDAGNEAPQIPADLAVKDHPLIQRRLTWTWDYHIRLEPRAYIDQLARWKFNTLLIWNEPYLLARPELVGYAHDRGVRIVVGMGLFSYDTAARAPLALRRNTECDQLCPNAPENVAWMEIYIRKTLSGLPGIDGVYFQTGNVDFPMCKCPDCAGLTDYESTRKQAQLGFRVVKQVNPGLEVYLGMLNNPINREVVARDFPEGMLMLWEGGTGPGILSDAVKAARLIAPGKTGWLFRIHQAGDQEPLADWQEMRARAPGRFKDWIRAAVSEGIACWGTVLENNDWARKPLYAICLMGQAAWASSLDGRALQEKARRIFAMAPPPLCCLDPLEQADNRKVFGPKTLLDSWRGYTAADYLYAGDTVHYRFRHMPVCRDTRLTLEVTAARGPRIGERYDPNGIVVGMTWDEFFHDVVPPGPDTSLKEEIVVEVTVDDQKKTWQPGFPVAVVPDRKTKILEGAEKRSIAFEFPITGTNVDVRLCLPPDTDSWLLIKEVRLVYDQDGCRPIQPAV